MKDHCNNYDQVREHVDASERQRTVLGAECESASVRQRESRSASQPSLIVCYS